MASVIGQICYLMKNNRASLEYFVFLDCIFLFKYINNILLICVTYIYLTQLQYYLFKKKNDFNYICKQRLIQE